MKKILAIMLLVMFLVGNVWAQPTPPATPPSPESQGIQIPQTSSSSQAPPSSESGQTLIPTSAASARATAPSTLATAPSYGTGAQSTRATAASSTYASTYLVVPPGVTTPNRFYIPYSPSTVAGCNYGQWMPMWLDVSGTGPLYMYEWYPNGRLVSKYLASIRYPGWQKMWFNGDATGWHILQYYCNGWSNYIYVYVYGYGLLSAIHSGLLSTTHLPDLSELPANSRAWMQCSDNHHIQLQERLFCLCGQQLHWWRRPPRRPF